MVTPLPTTELSVDASSLPIETVTVYQPSGAQVIRTLDVNLKTGTNVIQVTDLSSTAETESFRVDGLGRARLLVVQCILDRYPEIPKSDPIRDLTSQLKELQTEKTAREQEIAILTGFGKSMTGKPDLVPDQALAFFNTLFDKILSCGEIVRELNERIAQLDQKINKLRNSKSGAAFTKAMITILAGEDGPVRLRLIYRVLDAYWHPLYDLYTTSDDGKPSTTVSLHYRVNLQQHTGEDWIDAKLILSTSATDLLNAGIPKPDNLIVRPPTPPVQVKYKMSKTRSLAYSLASVDAEVDEEKDGDEDDDDEDEDDDMGLDLFGGGATPHTFAAPAPLAKLAKSAAAISKSPMAVSYTVEALTTIPSDGLSHKVLVAIIPSEAVITHITTPRKIPIAYIQCAVKNKSDHYLLPGTMSIFLNDSFVSQTNISDIATGDTFNCTLGMDTSIRVSHEITESSVTSPPSSFTEQHKTTKYVYTTKLQNRHTGDYPVNIVERSSIPIASKADPRIKVFLKGPAGLTESEDGQEVDLGRRDGFKVKWGRDVEDTKNGKKEGKFIWCGTIPPSEEVVLVSEWEVRAPVDTEWKFIFG